jgi:transcriptional regulator with XRE-family HTH domain
VKTPEQRGPIGAWAYEARDAAGISPEQVVERLGLAGIEVRPSTIRGIESGNKQPGRQLLRALAGVYGSKPPATTGDPEPSADLFSAITALVAALDADREERLALTRAIAALAQSLATRPEGGGSPELRALRESPG